MPNKNILITGATGAIGLEILRQLKALNRLQGISVFARKSRRNQRLLKPFASLVHFYFGDIRNYEDVREACKDQDIIMHLAAVIPTVEENTKFAREVNLGGTENLVAAIKEVAPNAFLIFSSSIAVYGDRIKSPNIFVSDTLDEDQHDQYAVAKIQAERLIQSSGLDWSILRLTAIMGIGNHKLSPLMFEMPLETKMEIATVRDTGRAFVHAIDQTSRLKHQIFNLGGGEKSRIIYYEFLSQAFACFGLGGVSFPEYAFARQNFHCGYYMDGDALEEILHFRKDDIASYFVRFKASVPVLQRYLTIPFTRFIKWYLLRMSKPYRAYKKGDRAKINFYFGPN